jgi:ribonuclease Z
VRDVRRDLGLYINYRIQIREWRGPASDQQLAYRDEQLELHWQPLDHSVLCLGYRLQEHARPGRFDPQAAEALGVPFGPLRGELQRGRDVVTPEGRSVRPEQVLGPPRRGRRLAFATDTALTPALSSLLREADLAFLEGMFLAEHAEEAAAKKHLTVEQAASVAARAKVARLVLTHLSPRYDASELAQLQAEASRHHPAARIARDGELYTVPLPE